MLPNGKQRLFFSCFTVSCTSCRTGFACFSTLSVRLLKLYSCFPTLSIGFIKSLQITVFSAKKAPHSFFSRVVHPCNLSNDMILYTCCFCKQQGTAYNGRRFSPRFRKEVRVMPITFTFHLLGLTFTLRITKGKRWTATLAGDGSF